MSNLPWDPIFTIERSGQPEVTVSGIISVVAGAEHKDLGRTLLALGDVSYELWSRSLLKPWQLLSHLHLLKEAYPSLEPQHFALITASHSGESAHLCVLHELLRIGELEESLLKCPAAMPLSAEVRMKLQREGHAPRPLFNNCSGKHIGYLHAIKAQSGVLEPYLQ